MIPPETDRRDGNSPASAWLEQKLLSQLNEKKIVVWLDVDGAYSGFVDGLRRRAEEKKFPAPVLAFRGSFLELMLALETEGSTIDKPPLLFHLPGFNKEKVRATPLLEMYECGLAWEVNLASLVGEAANGRLPLPEIEAFVKAPGLSLESADAWLGRAGAAGVDTHVEWIARLEPAELINHLTGTSTERPDGVDRALRARAATLFGTTSDWFDWFDQSESTEAIVAWLLCVEFVHDLRRPPKHPNLVGLTSLPPPTVKRCQAEAARLRQQLPERYRDWALTVEARLEGQEKTEPKDLGRIDTFRFEALTIYNGAVEALTRAEYRQVLEWFEAHEAGQGFWIQQDQSRRWAWSLLGEAARLGVALLEAPRPLEGATSLDEAARRYAEIAAPVDRAHRRFEQRHVALFGPLLPEQTRLSEAFEKLRFAWSDWADLLAKDFARICRDAGPLPPSELQQRAFFDEVVLPLLGQGDRVALFVLDALRFEMALELRDELAGSGVQVDLRPRMAELPTITPIGMNALPPVARAGRLTPVLKSGRFEGFRTGEATVSGPEDRKKAITARAAGRHPLFLKLEEVQQTAASTLKNKVAQTQLVVVHGLEIDEAGEAGFGVRVFEDILRNVIAAKQQLELAGVQHFVFTSDHGFLLQRGTASPRPFGSRGESNRRYAYSELDRSDAGHLTVPLNALGYDAPGFLVFREDTLEFDVGRPSGTFTHGGNSLQERVIPVLQVSRRRASAQRSVRFAIHCETAHPAMGAQHVRLRVTPAREPGQAPLDFARSQPVDLVARVPDRLDVPVVIKDVSGPNASVHAGGIRLDAATSDWTDVYFVLEGALNERLPVEFFVAGTPESSARPDAFYPVTFVPKPQPATVNAPPTPKLIIKALGGWAQRLGDPDAGKVFDHLEEHGSLNEAELITLLGSPRKARAFAARFDGYRERLTFEVEVSVGPEGKRYQRVA